MYEEEEFRSQGFPNAEAYGNYLAWRATEERHEAAGCVKGTCVLREWDDCPAIMFLECYQCGPRIPFEHEVWRVVVADGSVINVPRDPTQTYVLACGHVTI